MMGLPALRALAALCGVYYLGVGGACLLFPELLAAEFHVTPAGIHGMSTVRADLGGMFLAMGVLSCVGLYRRELGAAYLYSVAVLLLCIAIARVVGLLFDGFDAFTCVLALVEIAMAAVYLATAQRAGAGGN